MAEPVVKENDVVTSVFSPVREIAMPSLELPKELKFNSRLEMDGLRFLELLPQNKIPVAFLDPQYRGLLDKMSYGNEGRSRGKTSFGLPHMDEKTIAKFVKGIARALIPSGHLFLWVDKFHLCNGFKKWLIGANLDVVDLVTWDKGRIGMGYRTRRKSEHVIVIQKQPRRAKGVWTAHDIPDVITETVIRDAETHRKPVELQEKLLKAVSNPGDVVIDPAAGSFSVLEACLHSGRTFLGCDIRVSNGTD